MVEGAWMRVALYMERLRLEARAQHKGVLLLEMLSLRAEARASFEGAYCTVLVQ